MPSGDRALERVDFTPEADMDFECISVFTTERFGQAKRGIIAMDFYERSRAWFSFR